VIGSVPKCGPDVLVSTGEAAHPVVTLMGMGTWFKLSQMSMSHLMGEGPCGTSGAHTPICEAWYNPQGVLVMPTRALIPGGQASQCRLSRNTA